MTALSASAHETGEPHDENAVEPAPEAGTESAAVPLLGIGLFFAGLIVFAVAMGFFLGGPGKKRK